MFKKILVAVDGSRDADRAVQTGAELAGGHDSELHVCHVFHIPHYYATDLGEPLRAAVRKDAEGILTHSGRVAEEAGVAAALHLLREGHPADAILRLADELDVDLIVVGVRGRSPDEARPIGSVSTAVAQGAKCSVLLARRRPA